MLFKIFPIGLAFFKTAKYLGQVHLKKNMDVTCSGSQFCALYVDNNDQKCVRSSKQFK